MDEKGRIQSTVDAMTSAFSKGDIDGILRTYEPGAVVVGEPGKPVSGEAELRALFAGFIAVKPIFTFHAHEIVQAGAIAVHLSSWTMKGVAPDGSAVEQGGLSVAVLRRQVSGGWLMIIDDPYGDWILQRAASG